MLKLYFLIGIFYGVYHYFLDKDLFEDDARWLLHIMLCTVAPFLWPFFAWARYIEYGEPEPGETWKKKNVK